MAELDSDLEPFGEAEDYPLHPLDTDVFDAGWITAMEELDQVSESGLFEQVSSDGFIPSDWDQDQVAMEQTLEALGMDDQRLALQSGDEAALVRQLILHLGLSIEPRQAEWHRRRFVAKIQKIADRSPLAKKLRGDHLPISSQRIRDTCTKGQSSDISKQEDTTSVDWMPPPGSKRSLGGEREQVGTREQREAEEQQYWAQVVISILRKTPAPIWDLVEDSINQDQVIRGAIGSTRGSTMETYCKALTPLLNWLEISGKGNWPLSLVQVLDFLHAVGAKPCSPSYPKRFEQAFRWFEKIGSWPASDRMSSHEIFSRTVAYWAENLRAGLRPLKQAARYPWCLLVALELYVTNPAKANHLRLKAWTMLLKAWATLREDDVQHICPKKLRPLGELLITELMRSKTSGASKRVRELPVALWTGATVARTLWVETGLALLEELTAKDNDFLLPYFSATGIPTQRPATYMESACLAHLVIADLKIPAYNTDTETWEETGQKLISAELVNLWTEHSGRPVIPSSAQVLQIHKDECNYLGRWSPGGSADYSRAFRVVIHSIQTKVWKAVLQADPRLYEHEVLDRITSWGEARQWPDEQVVAQREQLRQTLDGFWKEIKKAGGPPEDVGEPAVPQDLVRAVPSVMGKAGQNEAPGFLLVYTRQRKQAKLHRVGGCQWTLVKLADAREVKKPKPEMYSSRCKLCFPRLTEQGANWEDGSSDDSEL